MPVPEDRLPGRETCTRDGLDLGPAVDFLKVQVGEPFLGDGNVGTDLKTRPTTILVGVGLPQSESRRNATTDLELKGECSPTLV
jgi:hypothetical protein